LFLIKVIKLNSFSTVLFFALKSRFEVLWVPARSYRVRFVNQTERTKTCVSTIEPLWKRTGNHGE